MLQALADIVQRARDANRLSDGPGLWNVGRSGQGYSKMHQGREYRFCSRTCLDKFDADPKQFVS
jgi:hypothetical protein